MHDAFAHDPFQMLIAVILSQRATDIKTIEVAKALFQRVPTVQQVLSLPIQTLEEIIRPIGFFRQKARHLHELAAILIQKHAGKVPQTKSDLISLPGVGPKTAHVLLTVCFHNPHIAVDIHVHRIPNRLGWITTTSVEESQTALDSIIPKKWWTDMNRIFVRHGQETCRPINPKCDSCPVAKWCRKVGIQLHPSK